MMNVFGRGDIPPKVANREEAGRTIKSAAEEFFERTLTSDHFKEIMKSSDQASTLSFRRRTEG